MFNKRLFLTKRRRRSNRFLDLIRLIQSLNPVVAYSISRRLSSIADKLIRVRRASDNSELDIGFVSGILDTQALIDFGGYNLLGYTEDLTNPVWTVGKTDVSFSAVVSSGITAPDNTNTAFNVRMSLEGATGGGDILDFKQNLTQNLTLGENYSTSIFLRSGDGVSKTLGFFNIAGDRKTITIGTEWQKYEFTNTSDSNGSGVLRFRLQGSSTDNLVNLEVWHPQAEIGSSASPYQPRLQGGASDCFVTTWYDQIGSNHATQTVSTNQPKIYDVLTGDVTRENGKPAMVFDGVNDTLKLINDNIIATQPNSIAAVAARKGGTNSSDYLLDGANGRQIIMIKPNDYALFSGLSITSSNSSDTNQHLFLGEFGLTTDKLFIDSIEVASGNAGSNNLGGVTIGGSLNSNNNVLNGIIQEMIIFDNNLTIEDRFKLHHDINNHYSIAPLVEILSPIVAYSISRRLSSSADKLIRVRRASDNSELDIGFVSGILDTQALIDFGGKNLLGYTTDFSHSVWKSQSGVSISQTNNFAPTGDNSWEIDFTNGAFVFQFIDQDISSVQNVVFSIYVKGVAGESINISITNSTNTISNPHTFNGDWQRVNIMADFQTDLNGNIDSLRGAVGKRSLASGFFETAAWQFEIESTPTSYESRSAGGASDCFVTTWYDQIGSNHATQTVSTNQPKIYDVLTGDVIRENGKPAMVFDGSASHLELVNNNLHSNTNGLFVTSVLKSNVVNNFDVIIGKYGLNNNRVWRLETNRAVVQSDPTSFNSVEATDSSQFSLDTNQMIASLNWDPNSPVQIHKNNVVKSIANTSVSALPSSDVNVLIGGSFGQNGSTPTSLLNGQLQEIVIFNRSLDNNTSLKLVSDINDHYGIF